MFLSIFKEKTLNERLNRFFSKLEGGKVKKVDESKNEWETDSIELKIDEGENDLRCYFNIDHRSIYIFHYLKEIDESRLILEREEYLIESGFGMDKRELEDIKAKIIDFFKSLIKTTY